MLLILFLPLLLSRAQEEPADPVPEGPVKEPTSSVTCCDELTSTYSDLSAWLSQAGNNWKIFQTDANGNKVAQTFNLLF
jgi:hypothetical protein